MKKKLKLNTNYSLLIPSKSIFKTGIFKELIGNIKRFNLNILPNHDCRLYYNSYENKYTLNIPTDISCKKVENRESICAIDPGENKFISFYGSQSYGFIGNDIRKPLLLIRDKIKRYQKILSKGINRKEVKIKHNKQLKTKIKKLYKKSKNIVTELHNQSANYLCKNYDKILIPKFETQKMISNKQTFKKHKLDFINTGQTKEEKRMKAKEFTKRCRLNKSVKYVLNNLSHYTFRQHLLDKSKEYGCQCIIVTEDYTSCVCSTCGHISDIYEDRIKYCEFCKNTCDRDYNGAKNILIKNINKVKWKAIKPVASS
jgi:transposase